MTDPLNEFSEALQAAGYRLPKGKSLSADDKWHRLVYLDEKNTSGRYRVKFITDDFAIGSFGSDRDTAGFHKWHSKAATGQKISKEERAHLKQQAEEYKALRDRELQARQAKIGQLLDRAVKRMMLSTGDHPYLKNKKIAAHGILHRRKGNELIVPMFNTTGLIMNVQRIPANGWKGFFTGAKVNGCCYPIGEFRDMLDAPLLICEGFATGASIHEVTGLPVRVAFNTANLKHIGAALREKYPHAKIIFCADNDQWTFKASKKPADVKADKIDVDDPRWIEWREAGLLWNPGVEKAQEAAAAIGGAIVIWPEFASITGKPTDFNDLRQREGDEVVANRLGTVLADRTGPADDRGPVPAWDGPPEGYEPDHRPAGRSAPVSIYPFKILGHNDGIYYFFPRNSGQIFSSSSAGLASIANLFRLANLDFWNDHFNDSGKLSTRKVAELAANALTQEAHDVGVFKPSNVRGAGAWMDQRRPVIHCGDHLLVDGDQVQPHKFASRYVYPLRAADFPTGATPLSSQEAVKLRDICGAISWESKLSGDLLAGWIVIAPVCGALDWRPHIWVEGESESGKTTVIERIIRPLLDGVSLRFDGGTTEAAIRQEMGIDALPVIYDEAEPENLKDRIIMDGLLLLARRASSGGRIGKGGSGGVAESFNIRSCFCFAGINPAIKQRADESRISRLVIKRATFEGADAYYKQMKITIRETLTRDFAHRLIARTIENLPTLIANSEIFTDAAADVLTSRRAADQIGPMLAGLFLLTSTARIDYEKAVAFIRKHDWTSHTAIAEQSDPERLITYIATSTTRYRNGEYSIGELISRAHQTLYDTSSDADHYIGQHLRSLGIWVRNDGVLFANKSPPLERILLSTPWVSWSRPMKDIQGAEHIEPLKFSTGLNSRSVKVPLQAFGIEEIPS